MTGTKGPCHPRAPSRQLEAKLQLQRNFPGIKAGEASLGGSGIAFAGGFSARETRGG